MSLETDDDLQPLEGTALDTLGAGDDDGGDADDMLAGYEGVDRGRDAVAFDRNAPRNTGDDDDEQPAARTQPDGTDDKPRATPQPTAAPVRIGRWTEDEIAQRFEELESLKKGQASVAGHIGDLRNRLMGQKPRELTVNDFPGIVEEFGEQYAQALVKDMNKLGPFGGHAGPSQADIDAIVSARTEQQMTVFERRLEKKAVLRAHKDADDYFNSFAEDGKTIVAGPKAAQWSEWLATLTPQRQQEVVNSWDADVMIAALSECKEYQQAKTAKTGKPTGSVPEARKSRVDRAVAPRGTGGAATQPAEDAFAGGYQAARSGRG